MERARAGRAVIHFTQDPLTAIPILAEFKLQTFWNAVHEAFPHISTDMAPMEKALHTWIAGCDLLDRISTTQVLTSEH